MGYKYIIIRCLQGNSSGNFCKAVGGEIISDEDGNVEDVKIIENAYKFEL